MSVQALLRRSKKALEEARPTRGQDLEKLKAGENYLRIFPNKADPENGDFFHPYGLHYAKQTGPDGKIQYSAVLCQHHTHNKHCAICDMVEEAKIYHRGNEAMKDMINDVRAGLRYVVMGMLSNNENFSGCEGPKLIDLPQTVLDDIIALMEQDYEDEVGEPLSRERGFAYLIKRTGTGRDTKYEITPKRKLKSPITQAQLDAQPNYLDFVNQNDSAKIPLTTRMVSATLGIAPPAGLADSAGALPGMSVGALPGMSEGSTYLPKEEPVGKGIDNEILNEELERAEEAVYEEVKESKAAEAAPAQEDSFEDELAALAALGM
ncbi:regulator [Klebsiella quasipneumoniae]|uniref:regulator n=1 Tax=Klebsiella pneumoniae complex TaxID=3390273 RepID=UPI000DE65D86|nr:MULTISPECIES: regulator [Klebsiella]HCI6032481.1 regulator [Klebsiella quasipneumoniae subsp. quasipneumoniae]HDH1444480.1 regulator [Klebsiella quasipneumoniae subsp. similipneumoniae]MDN4858051.1 regulator [Klebsiella pneumoniae]SSG18998.1 putative regulator [Klebsiella quasipneumoniae]SSH50137.1 putative regulator [Klebsiella quasipneumoniae]